jgi:hypothetical protein
VLGCAAGVLLAIRQYIIMFSEWGVAARMW